MDADTSFADGRLRAKPLLKTSIKPILASGTHQLTLPHGWQADFHLPYSYDDSRAAPLLLVFHGASRIDGGLLAAAIKWADAHHALVIAQKSIGFSWDIVRRRFGVDVEVTNYLINWVMRRHAIDVDHIGIAGFSDGASYALSVGLCNGDLFSDILAFSPGFILPAAITGAPRIFLTHGQVDPVLSVDCSRRIAHKLLGDGYDVFFHEFDGTHLVPLALAANAFNRFLTH